MRAALPRLPSFLYSPTSGELEGAEGALSWVVGRYAQARAAEVPGRGFGSAKSWLSHAAVDRSAALLPVAALEDVPKLSPGEAATRVLAHLRPVLDELVAAEGDAEEMVVLTVPASFDAVARHLTLSAARAAGFRARLLEEPLAAFYAFQADASDAELRELLGDHSRAAVVVCDVGGGTTDFSLVELRAKGPEISLHRTAVGEHLLLGGDNVDLALTTLAERRLGGGRLPTAEFAQLLSSCRAAKERLLGEDAPVEAVATLSSRGSSLVGATRSIAFSREEVRALLLDGFLPAVPLDARPATRRQGLQAFGLPYAADAAITRHLAAFLSRHVSADAPVVGLLLNGGLFNSPIAVERLHGIVQGWYGASIRLLPASPDDAVALGAVRYAEAILGRGRRVQAGTTSGYYLRVRDGRFAERTLVCIVPRGSADGERHAAGGREFLLTTGSTVRFDAFAHATAGHAPGDEAELDESFVALPPVGARLDAASTGESVRVRVEGELSAVGSLELALVPTLEPSHRWELSFELGPAPFRASESPPSARASSRGAPTEAAIAALDGVFGKGKLVLSPKALLRELEQQMGPRVEWGPSELRGLFDELTKAARVGARRRSEDHERVFWQLAGFLLRPGFGYVGDEERARRLVALWDAGLAFPDPVRSWQQYWIAWRRLAAGLGAEAQNAIRDTIDPVLAPSEARLKPRKGFRPQAKAELWELACFLERADVRRRVSLGDWIVERTWTDRNPELWRHLASLGARVPTYASAHAAVPPRVAERWLGHLLREKWQEVPTAAVAAVRMARITADRERDVSAEVRAEVLRALDRIGASEELRLPITEFIPVSAAERRQELGDELPAGLTLID